MQADSGGRSSRDAAALKGVREGYGPSPLRVYSVHVRSFKHTVSRMAPKKTGEDDAAGIPVFEALFVVEHHFLPASSWTVSVPGVSGGRSRQVGHSTLQPCQHEVPIVPTCILPGPRQRVTNLQGLMLYM